MKKCNTRQLCFDNARKIYEHAGLCDNLVEKRIPFKEVLLNYCNKYSCPINLTLFKKGK